LRKRKKKKKSAANPKNKKMARSSPHSPATDDAIIQSGIAAAEWESQMWSEMGHIQGIAVLGIVSHQLKQPKSTMQRDGDYLNALQSDDAQHFQGRLFRQANQGVTHIQQLFDGLHAFRTQDHAPQALVDIYSKVFASQQKQQSADPYLSLMALHCAKTERRRAQGNLAKSTTSAKRKRGNDTDKTKNKVKPVMTNDDAPETEKEPVSKKKK